MTKRRILVVDDEPNVVKSCVKLLELNGFEAQGATGGADAIGLYKRERFDLAMIDLRMPEIGGMEVLTAIREYDPKATVIIFTAYGTKESIVEALRLGAAEFLKKPLDTEAMITTIKTLLEQADARLEEATPQTTRDRQTTR